MFRGLGTGTTGLYLFEGSTATGELLLNGFDGSGPDKGLWVFVPGCEESDDGILQVNHAMEDATTEGFAVQVSEPSFHEVHPAGTGGYEVRHESGVAFQPGLNFGVLVCPVIVHDQMQGNLAGELGVEPSQEFQELLVAMAFMAFPNDLPL